MKDLYEFSLSSSEMDFLDKYSNENREMRTAILTLMAQDEKRFYEGLLEGWYLYDVEGDMPKDIQRMYEENKEFCDLSIAANGLVIMVHGEPQWDYGTLDETRVHTERFAPTKKSKG